MVNKLSEAMKKRWSNPEQRKKFILSKIGNKNRSGTTTSEEGKKNMSKARKKYWSIQKNRDEQSKRLKAFHKKNIKPKPNVTKLNLVKLSWTDERKEECKKRAINLWKDLKFRAKLEGRKRSEESKSKMSLAQIRLNLERGSENHPRFVDGRSVRLYGVGYSRRMSKKAIKRDGGKCVLCGSKKNLHAHHKDFSKDNNLLDNLITFCCKCHFKEHRGVHHDRF